MTAAPLAYRRIFVAASIAILAGRVVGVSWLVAPCVRVLRTGPATETSVQNETDAASTRAIG